jgi:hypothetical protein
MATLLRLKFLAWVACATLCKAKNEHANAANFFRGAWIYIAGSWLPNCSFATAWWALPI